MTIINPEDKNIVYKAEEGKGEIKPVVPSQDIIFYEDVEAKKVLNLEKLGEVKAIAADIDKSDIETVTDFHKRLVKIRTNITKQGLGHREFFNAQSKLVLNIEKQYLGVLSETEAEFKQLVADAEKKALVEARKEGLPMKKAQLDILNHRLQVVSDEEILDMDDKEWNAYLQSEMEYSIKETERLVAEKKAAEEKVKTEEEEKKKLEAQIEKDKKEALKKAEADKEAALKQVEADKKKAIADEKAKAKAKADKIIADNLAEEKRVEKEKAEIEADKKYQKFLDDNNYIPGKDIVQKDGNTMTLFKFVATYKI